ncbi:MAG: IPT/TIG domain-containing protein, partial [Chloroflexi bacterium]|nr:IPT/TIG domain-containing protein [Chloroflexota bacterium]
MVNTFRNLISQAARKKIDASYRTYVAVALVAAMLLSTYNVFAVPTPGLVAVGPTSNATGYPSWYKDSNGTRLELCLDGGLNPICGYLPGDIPNPAAPITVPDNYPATAEAFYMLGSALMETDSATGGRAILVLALEAAFSGGTVVSGDQITFGRIRIWIDNLIPNAQYRVTHPYGVDNFTADPVFGRRMIRYVEDIGIGAPGDFSGALNSRIGPFLFWDPAIAPAAPAGYIGDPDILHEVAGSPLNTNFFRVEGPAGSFPGSVDQCADPALGDDPIATDDCIQMDQFSLIGKYATNADVNANRATYTQGNANGGQIDVFANTEPGMDIQVDGFGNPILTTDGNGYYFTQVSYTGNPPAQLQVINTSDTPDTSKTISVTDLVTITKAEFITATGTLRVDALSSDTYNDPILTVAGFGDLDNNNGRLEVSGLAIPPQNVTVTSAKGGSATAAVAVNVVPPIPVPTITGFTPINGVVGTIVTITGTNFNSASDVSFNGIPAVFTVDSDTSISATVPGTATTGLVSVTTPDGTAASIGNYTVIVPPTITNFTPSNGLVGASVTITGTEFTSATSVMFNGMAATFTVDSDTQITAQIPDGASSGPISVANPAGTVISAANFTVDVPWPLVVSIVRASTNPSNANTVNFTVTFSKPVTGVDGSDFSVLNAGTTMT